MNIAPISVTRNEFVNVRKRCLLCHVRNIRLPVIHLVIVASLLFAGCTTSGGPKAYPGAERDISEVGVVVPDLKKGNKTKSIYIREINGRREVQEWRGSSASLVRLLPGDHQFLVEFSQYGQHTDSTLVDLISSTSDIVSAARHGESTIVFPVKAGFVHRIHYDVKDKVFSITREPTIEPIPTVSFYSPDDTITCVKDADKSVESWCELLAPAAEPYENE